MVAKMVVEPDYRFAKNYWRADMIRELAESLDVRFGESEKYKELMKKLQAVAYEFWVESMQGWGVVQKHS